MTINVYQNSLTIRSGSTQNHSPVSGLLFGTNVLGFSRVAITPFTVISGLGPPLDAAPFLHASGTQPRMTSTDSPLIAENEAHQPVRYTHVCKNKHRKISSSARSCVWSVDHSDTSKDFAGDPPQTVTSL